MYRSNSGLRGPILKLLSATGYAAMLGYAGMLVLVRLYPKESFGLFDFVISVVAILTPFVSLRYEDSLMLAEKDRDGAHSFLLAFGTTIVLSLSLLLFLPFKVEIALFFKKPLIAEWLWVVPVALIVVRFAKFSELWLGRQERFGRISIGQMSYTTTMTGIKIGGGIISNSPAGLVYGYLAGSLTGILVNVRLVLHSLRVALSGGISMSRIGYLATRYRRFPIFTMPAAVVAMMGTRLPFLLLAYYFSFAALADFGRAFSVVFVPLSLLGVAVSQVFFVRGVEARRAGTVALITDTVHQRLVFLAWFPTVVVMIAGPDIFQFLLGEPWRTSGVIARYIAPWILFSAVASPLSRLFDVLERQRLELLTNSGLFIVVAAALVYGGSRGDLFLTLLLLGIGGGLVRIWQITVLLSIAGMTRLSFLKPYLRYALYSLPWLLLVAVAVIWTSPFVVTITTAAGGLGYLASVVYREGLLDIREKASLSDDETRPHDIEETPDV